MIILHWLELLMSQINFYGPKDFRAIEVLLCISLFLNKSLPYQLETPMLGAFDGYAFVDNTKKLFILITFSYRAIPAGKQHKELHRINVDAT